MRERPPDVVSPLMLALTMRALTFSSASVSPIKATQPVPRLRPYSALSESPTTRTTGRLLLAACASAWPKDPAVASAHTLQASALK
ncbi:hypothetical protein D9M68_925200 [compost metagenome]